MPRKLLITNLDNPAAVTAAGALIRGWALAPQNPPPQGIDSIGGKTIKAHLESAGIEFAPSVTRVVLHQSTNTEMHIVLSPKDSLQSALDDINANPSGYEITGPIKDIVLDRRDHGTNFDEPHEVLPFYDFRIGDYTLQHCM